MSDLAKRLKYRHVNMIALGGTLGTGMFLASGYSIYIGGPGGSLLAYSLMGLVVYFLMASLAEMTVYEPSTGTFCDYSSRYVGESFGFAMGYNYWLNWAITAAVEVVAASLVMHYWFPDANSLLFCGLFFLMVIGFNLFSVNVYGELEYFLSFLKVSVVIAFLVLGSVAVFYQPHFGVARWHFGDGPFHNGHFGFISAFLFAGFSFQGVELIGVASGEVKNPETSIPKSIRLVFWRLLFFYLLAVCIIGLLFSYNDPRLVSQHDVSMSPYTLIFSDYLSQYAGDFINFVILVALLSAANASVYASSRILWYLSKKEQAPAVFGRLTKKGVPVWGLLATVLIGSVIFVSSKAGSGVLFSYIVKISALSGFVAWFGIALCHLYFRKQVSRLKGEGVLSYKARFYPFAQIISLVMVGFVILAQFIPILHEPNYHFSDLLMVYSSLIAFVVFYLGHKLFFLFKSRVAPSVVL